MQTYIVDCYTEVAPSIGDGLHPVLVTNCNQYWGRTTLSIEDRLHPVLSGDYTQCLVETI